MTEFFRQVPGGWADSHKRLVDWAGEEKTETAVELEEERRGDVSLIRREREQDTNADLTEQKRGEKQSSVSQTRRGAEEVPQCNGSGKQEADADIWYYADWDMPLESLLYPATASEGCGLDGEC
ncbi:hypothetical protein NDU88_008337 [Pleurodeles waltl]|uniref:Uncharacterized protein n=1 Tax=Pleurodeles waltl TaxID=8319 RepID=A0AAV7NW02_PLEWA|nr:hypothetical protein NDU88_008337 [Pleurodeles waltl]